MHILLLSAAAALLLQATPGSRPAAEVADVAWMAGHWIGVDTNDVSEEVWLPPAAGTMAGMWRWAVDGRPRLFELLTIGTSGGSLELRLRHFRPDLTALEEKDRPFVLPLVGLRPHEAVFEGIGSDGGPLRITYRRAGDRLEASVEKAGSTQHYAYRLKSASPLR
jgi:hypothetical protein